MTDESSSRRHKDLEQIEGDKQALQEQNLRLARELAEKDKNYVPTEEERRVIEELEKSQREAKRAPAEPPRPA